MNDSTMHIYLGMLMNFDNDNYYYNQNTGEFISEGYCESLYIKHYRVNKLTGLYKSTCRKLYCRVNNRKITK